MTITLLVFMLTSCIGDNMDDCAVETTLRFEYTLNESSQDLFTSEVTHLDLLVYNDQGDLLKTEHVLQHELHNGNTFNLNLQESGTYTFLAWANITDVHFEKHYTPSIEDLRVKLNMGTSPQADPVHGSLFYGKTTMSIHATTNNSKVMSLTKNTHLLHIVLEETGNNQAIAMDDYTVEISGSNGTYNYENKTTGSDLLHYKAHYSLQGISTLQTDYTLLRLLIGDDLNIRILAANGTVIYDEPLTAKIMESPNYLTNQDLDRTDEYTLRYQIDKTNGGGWAVSLLSINDWTVTNQGGGLN